MLVPVSIAFLALLILGGLTGLLLAFASQKLAVPIDPRIEQVTEELPGANCGACGYPGCSGYAEAIVLNNAPINLCKPGGSEAIEAIAKIMGITAVVEQQKQTAFVYCQGGIRANNRAEYSGTKTCQAAVLVSGGHKQCVYGCLGFGDCVKACKFDAIKIGEYGVPIIDQEKCTNCGACITACPKGIIKTTLPKPIKRVVCSSHDKGSIAKTVCGVACIGCGVCVKSCPFEAITIDNFLAVIDPEKCTNCGICVSKCPTKAIA